MVWCHAGLTTKGKGDVQAVCLGKEKTNHENAFPIWELFLVNQRDENVDMSRYLYK